MFDLCDIYERNTDFYNFYKVNIENILNEIYQRINSPLMEGNNLIDILYKFLLTEEKIELKKYDLICFIEGNYVILKNTEKNLATSVIYLKKMKIQKDEQLNEYWVCNDDIAMLICKKEKYIYYKRPKYILKNYDDEKSIVSMIADTSLLNYVIMNDKVIYTSNEPFFRISEFKAEFEKIKEKKTIINYLEGMNSLNFGSLLYPYDVQFLRGNISLENIIKRNKKKLQYYLYNPKIGLTLEILYKIDLNLSANTKDKMFYINVYFIYNQPSKALLEKYLAYNLTKLFDNFNDYEKFYNEFSKKISKKWKKNNTRERLIYKIAKFIIKNYHGCDSLYIFFDNIYNEDIFLKIAEINKKLEEKQNSLKKIYFCNFVELEIWNLKFINTANKDYNFEFINNDNSIRPDEYIRTRNGDYFYKLNTIDNLKYFLDNKFKNKNSFEILSTLLRMKYLPFLLHDYPEDDNIPKILKEFFDYFHVTCTEENLKIRSIEFKNDIIKNYFNERFKSLICDIVSKNELKIFDSIINSSVEGVLLERQIILNLIASMSFNKLKIDKIYNISKFPSNFKFNYGEKILIIQKFENSPMYDFGVITYDKNELILKVYQVGINKSSVALKKLNKDVIIFDIEYFLEKIKFELGIDIKKYVFGIITTKNGYDSYIEKIKCGDKNMDDEDYKKNIDDKTYYNKDNDEDIESGECLEKGYENYKTMKKFCEENDYEFIIFDKNTKKSFIQQNNSLIDFNYIENTNEQHIIYNSNIYAKCEINNLTKLGLSKKDYFPNNEIKSILEDENITIKYITKFETSSETIPDINKDNFYLCFNYNNKYYMRDKFGNINPNLNETNLKVNKFIGCIINRRCNYKLCIEKGFVRNN